MKICPVGAELFHANKHTDMTKLVVTFCAFADTSLNLLHKSLTQTGMVVFNKFSYSVTYCSVT